MVQVIYLRFLRERLFFVFLERLLLFLEREPRRRPPIAGAAGAAFTGLFTGAFAFLEPNRPDRNPVEAGAAGAGALIY